MASASILQLSEVTKACSGFLEKQLHPSNCIGIGLFAHRQYCVDLKQAACDYTAVRNLLFIITISASYYYLYLCKLVFKFVLSLCCA